ncbi:ExbD/TolR family protein [Roseovarius aquimarinus]|uniref:ExbD/TolR family protein n=1 Tax=Roseovarius aquimarinus TaxID=1229156 RepID=A0ABW7I5L2_9RHOB
MASRARRRKRLSLTSLIDVIFLLLLFFMLSSTFSKFSEIELSAASSGAPAPSTERPLFLQLMPDDLRLNGRSVALEALGEAIGPPEAESAPRPLLVALKGEVSAQRLTDLLAALRGVDGLAPTILGGAAP